MAMKVVAHWPMAPETARAVEAVTELGADSCLAGPERSPASGARPRAPVQVVGVLLETVLLRVRTEAGYQAVFVLPGAMADARALEERCRGRFGA